MDYIDFKIKYLDQNTFQEKKFFDIDILLNNKKVSNSVFNSIDTLASSSIDNCEFNLYTCSCGVPECAGYYEPIQQYTNDDIVTWKFPEKSPYIIDKQIYNFEKKRIFSTLTEIKEHILNLSTQNVFINNFYEEISLKKYSFSNKKFNKYLNSHIKYFQSIENFDKFFTKKVLKIFNALPQKINFNISYCNTTSKITYNISDLVLLIIRSNKAQSQTIYFKQVTKALLAIKGLIYFNNKQLLIHILNKKYIDFDGTKCLYFFLPYDLQDLFFPYEENLTYNFDFNSLSISITN